MLDLRLTDRPSLQPVLTVAGFDVFSGKVNVRYVTTWNKNNRIFPRIFRFGERLTRVYKRVTTRVVVNYVKLQGFSGWVSSFFLFSRIFRAAYRLCFSLHPKRFFLSNVLPRATKLYLYPRKSQEKRYFYFSVKTIVFSSSRNWLPNQMFYEYCNINYEILFNSRVDNEKRFQTRYHTIPFVTLNWSKDVTSSTSVTSLTSKVHHWISNDYYSSFG